MLDERQLESSTSSGNEPSGRQLFDISDYLDSCINCTSITGIQRVQEALAQELLAHSSQAVFVVVDQMYSRIWVLDREDVFNLITSEGLRRDLSGLNKRGRIAEAVRNRARLHNLNKSDVLINLGAFWSVQYDARFEEYLVDSECSFIPLIYDVIPVDHPELCEGNTVKRFIHVLPGVLCRASSILTISEFTKSRLQAFGAGHGFSLPPINVVTLAHQLTQQPILSHPIAQPPSPLSICDNYILCVGTMEPRKNHLRLAEVWAQMANDIECLPVLLIVGKVGWIDPVALARIAHLSKVTKKITLAHQVTDEELTHLYQQCMFTVFISIDEGWGLPVGESLAFGKVCLAANTGAVPEVGGEFAVYVNPLDDVEIDIALRSLVLSTHRLHVLEERIRHMFKPKSWSQVAGDVMAISQMHLVTERRDDV